MKSSNCWNAVCGESRTYGVKWGEKLEITSKTYLSLYVFDELLKYGIEPVVTISHYETPLALANNYGGWLDRKVIGFYVRYCETIFNRYKDKVKYWMTFNEINIMDFMPVFAGGVTKNDPQSKAQSVYHQFLASAKVV